MRLQVLRVAELKHGETRVFSFPTRYGDMQGFVIRSGEFLHAYENKCRHWPIPLDYGDADFFFASVNRIVCKTHGAMYDPDTGECDDGPCAGEFLTRFPVELDGGDAWVTVPDLEPDVSKDVPPVTGP